MIGKKIILLIAFSLLINFTACYNAEVYEKTNNDIITVQELNLTEKETEVKTEVKTEVETELSEIEEETTNIDQYNISNNTCYSILYPYQNDNYYSMADVIGIVKDDQWTNAFGFELKETARSFNDLEMIKENEIVKFYSNEGLVATREIGFLRYSLTGCTKNFIYKLILRLLRPMTMM